MNKDHHRFFLVVALLSCAGSLRAGWRPPNAQEKEFYRISMETIARSLPAGPAGWQMTGQTEIRELEKVYAGSEKEPFRLDYSIEWTDVEKMQLGKKKVMDAWMEHDRARTGDPQTAALKAEADKLAAAVGQAAGKGDTAGMERLMKQVDAVHARLKVIQDRSLQQRDALRIANEAHDFRVRIAVSINSFSAVEKTPPAAPVAGLAVYRTPGRHADQGGWEEEVNQVFWGRNVRIAAEGENLVPKVPPRSQMPYPAVHYIHVRVDADPPRARQVLESIQWDLLKGLLR